MPLPTRAALGRSTLKSKDEFYVRTGTTGAYTYVPVHGVEDGTFNIEQTTVEQNDYDIKVGRKEITGRKANIDLKVRLALTTDATPEKDPGQELLRAAATGAPGDDVVVTVIAVENIPGYPELGEIWVAEYTVAWTNDGGDAQAASGATVKLEQYGNTLAQLADFPA